MSHDPRSSPLRVAGLFLVLLLFAGQVAAAAADTWSDATHSSSAWVRASGARSLSPRTLPLPDCGPALPLSPAELAPSSTVVCARTDAAPETHALRSAHRRVRLPRGPPFAA